MGPLRAPESPQEVTRCRDGADSQRLAAVRTVRARRSVHVVRSGQPRSISFSWKKLSWTRRSSLICGRPGGRSATVLGATSAPQIRWRWRHRACFRRRMIRSGLKRRQVWTTWNTLPFGAGHPEVTSPLLRRVARRHVDHDAFSTLPVRERPVSCLTATHLRHVRAGASSGLNRPSEGTASLRRGRMMPLPPKRQARLGRVARKRARCVRAVDPDKSGLQFPPEAGRGEENFSGLRFSR